MARSRGIIHVSRKGARVSLTNVVISYPGGQTRDMNRMRMWMALHERPEVRAWMKASNCRFGGEPFHAKNFKPHTGPISIEPGRMTVALDEVAQQSGENYWAILQRYSPKTHSLLCVYDRVVRYRRHRSPQNRGQSHLLTRSRAVSPPFFAFWGSGSFYSYYAPFSSSHGRHCLSG
jgi:hypothetical protein